MSKTLILADVIGQLKTVKSNTEKLQVLKNNARNTSLREYLRQIICPSVSFYIAKKCLPEVSRCGEGTLDNVDFLVSVTEPLYSRKISGNSAKRFIKEVVDSLTEEYQEVYLSLLCKERGLGVSSATVNKVWENLCISIPYQRCSLPTERTLKHFQDGKLAIIQLKGDGMFAAFNRSNGEVITRKGNKFPSWLGPYLLQHKQELVDEVLEGELLCSHAGKLLPRKEGNGIMNSVLQGGELPQGVDIEFHVWNSLIVEHWKAGETRIDYDTSFGCTVQSVELLGSPRIKLIEHAYFETLEQAMVFNEIQLSKGLEGSVVKTLSHKWKSGTSSECVKLKKTKEVDLLWVSSVEGEGRNRGRLGAMVLQSSCGALKVNCGTGLSDAEREMLWDSQPELPCIVTVAANDVVSSKGKESASLFLPRFIELRCDKDEADDLERIKEIFAQP